VEPRRDCPHVGQLPATAAAAASAKCGGLLTAGCEMCGDTSENWVCLATGRLLCSRYVAGHMKAHAEGRAREPDNGGGVVALSLSDLSAWCFQCDSCAPPSPLVTTAIYIYLLLSSGITVTHPVMHVYTCDDCTEQSYNA